MKRVALINDLSGVGRCSLSVALPIISASGHECAVLPTAVLSNHTAFPCYTFFDFTDYMEKYTECWQQLGITFDAVYSGFLGSEHQIDIALEFISRFGNSALKLIDPVMGDDGKIYTTYNSVMLEHMKRLVSVADIITPNLTELCVLADTEYPPSITLEGVSELCHTVAKCGVKKIAVTGLESGIVSDASPDKIINLVYDSGSISILENEKVPTLYCGTGDVFASVLCGETVRGESFERAVKKAADFTELCTRDTYNHGGDRLYGVRFEDKLNLLGAF